MTTSGNTQISLRRLRKLPAIHLKSLCEGVVRRLRKLPLKSLLSLAKVRDAKVPHTPYELSQRLSALRSSFYQWTRRGRRPARGTSRAACRP
jgi:hypothetical protein